MLSKNQEPSVDCLGTRVSANICKDMSDAMLKNQCKRF